MNPQLQKMLQKAIQAFQSGNFDSADLTLKRVLQVDSKNLPALHILGLIKASQSNYKEAADYLARAARIHPSDASIQYNLAKALADSGNDKDALVHHKKAVALAPNNPEAWLSYGKTASNLGRYQDALVCYDNSLGLKPDYAEAALNKGATLKELKRYEEAITFADQALAINPNLAGAWTNKGVALKELKRFDEAIAHYDHALSLKPDYHEAWINKGVTLHELKRFDEAIAHYDHALSLKPDYAEAALNKGATLHELKRFDEAIAHYDHALSLKPDYAEALSNKGVTLHELKRFDEAIAHYDHALSLKPDIAWLYGNLLYVKMKICNWSGLAEALEDISKKVVANENVINPFVLLALRDDALLHKKCSEIYAQNTYPANSALGPIPKAAKREKIRIAYFSPDFRNHPVSFLTSELFEIHDRSRFEVFAFSLQKAPDGDEMNIRLRKGFDKFIDVDNMSDLDIAQLVRKLEVDIAIDLTGPTQHSRTQIFSYRAAPIQVNWLGYPGTIGADFIDYIVADKTIISAQCQKFYSEKVVSLPDTYIVDDSKRIASSRVFTKKESGLPENVFIFCCFNNDYKFNPQVLDGWSRILLAAKNSVLWISENNERFRVNITIEFEKRGIDSTRIIFAPRLELMADHLARYTLADLFLDTHPYNAHTTTVDSLKAGIPVLTLKGQSFPSRVAASLLNATGLSELITSTQEEYEALAIGLAKNPQKLSDIKLRLANNRLTTPLFDTPLFTKNIEAAYIKMMERYWADLGPENISTQ
jgi:predicted O-linked N-acetylglucosamine transferase (SPINDLY family)